MIHTYCHIVQEKYILLEKCVKNCFYRLFVCKFCYIQYIKDLESGIFLALFDTFIVLYWYLCLCFYEHFLVHFSKHKVCYAQDLKSELFCDQFHLGKIYTVFSVNIFSFISLVRTLVLKFG